MDSTGSPVYSFPWFWMNFFETPNPSPQIAKLLLVFGSLSTCDRCLKKSDITSFWSWLCAQKPKDSIICWIPSKKLQLTPKTPDIFSKFLRLLKIPEKPKIPKNSWNSWNITDYNSWFFSNTPKIFLKSPENFYKI
jgi:hypothetical protein